MNSPPDHSDRAANERYAYIHGYYWLPCAICGDMYGGHEAGDQPLYNDKYGASGHLICYKAECAKQAEILNEEKRKIYGSIFDDLEFEPCVDSPS